MLGLLRWAISLFFIINIIIIIIIQKHRQTIPDIVTMMSQQKARTPNRLVWPKAVEIAKVRHRHLHLNNCKLFSQSMALFYVSFRSNTTQ